MRIVRVFTSLVNGLFRARRPVAQSVAVLFAAPPNRLTKLPAAADSNPMHHYAPAMFSRIYRR